MGTGATRVPQVCLFTLATGRAHGDIFSWWIFFKCLPENQKFAAVHLNIPNNSIWGNKCLLDKKILSITTMSHRFLSF